MKRQFKVRLIEKSLLEPKAAATMATSTPTSVVQSTTTTAKPSPIPVMMYNLAQGKFQGVPNPTKRFQDEENPFTPILTMPLWHSNPRLLLPHPQPH